MDEDDTEGTTTHEEGKPQEKPSPVETATEIVESSHSRSDSVRQVVDGALTGTALVFLGTFLALPGLDGSLQFAVIAFAVAIPFLVWGFMFASFDVRSKRDDAQGLWMIAARTVQVLEVVGYVGVYVGVVATVGHLSQAAGIILFFAPLAVLVLTVLLSLPVGIAMLVQSGAVKRAREQQRNERAAKPPKTRQPRR